MTATRQKQTKNVREFVEANKSSLVVAGTAKPDGGGTYRLADGQFFRFTLAESQSMAAPNWKL